MSLILTAEAVRNIDRDAIEIRNIPGTALMLKAGRAVADCALELCRRNRITQVQIFCGNGNNGGDGFVSAMELQKRGGLQVDVFYLGDHDKFSADTKYFFESMCAAGIKPRPLTDLKLLNGYLRENALWIDALLGTGIQRPLRGRVAELLTLLERSHKSQSVIAVDIPSGIDAGSGRLLGPALRADITVCMGFYKSGNYLQEGRFYSGTLLPVELNYPLASYEHAKPAILLCNHETVRSCLQPLSRTAHKYGRGQVLLLAASAAMPGALTLASQAVLKSGAGMLRALLPGNAAPVLLGHLPEAVVHRGGDPEQLGEKDLPQLRALLREKSRVLLAGPGYGRAAAGAELLRAVLHDGEVPLVLDADALFNLKPDDLRDCPAPRVITPHFSEFARFLNKDIEEVRSAPLELALELAVNSGTVVHLKGSTSLTALPSAAVYLHDGGAPGL
ncbi:MAG: NAD(P)H-hydrate epimerase, partial [Candidatus Marinimicrobia bacterium]|nr:NAD(P)H-hydrate epimerase [Candidatus Neomarinimicrobiota bacterium]